MEAEMNKIMPITRVKRDLLEILKNVENEDSTITVTRNGEAAGVIMSTHRYEALMETIEILADKEVMAELAKSSEDFKSGRVYTDEKVWQS